MNVALYLFFFLSVALSGCGVGGAAQAVKPQPITASLAVGEKFTCNSPDDEADLLIIDLPANKRADMEVLMGDGLVAVKYDCNSLKILKSCHAEGTYAYKGILLKEELIRLENADEIRANLPMSGAGVAAKMGVDFEAGATLDLAVVMVGQARSARYELGRDELKGRCEGATHFVKSVYLGAFAMKRGEKANVAAAADLFGRGAASASSSGSSSQQSDGDLEACRKSSAGASAPARGCGALLRMFLIPISSSGSAPSTVDDKKENFHVPTCPSGMKWKAGKCTKKGGEPSCSLKEPGGCARPCEAGDSAACGILGWALRYGKGLAKSREKAAAVFNRGCELGHGASCLFLSLQYRRGKGVTTNLTSSFELARRGCALGVGRACFYSGMALMRGEGVDADERKGFSAYEQGCAAGDASSCTNLGMAYSKGRGVEADVVKSFKLYVRACEGGSSTACYNVGTRYSKGKGVTKNLDQMLRHYVRSCHLKGGKACYLVGKETGDVRWIQRACKLGYEVACGDRALRVTPRSTRRAR